MLLMLLLDGGRLDFEARVGAGERVAACDDACRRCRMPSRPIPSRCEHAYLIHLGVCVPQVPPMSPSTSNERLLNCLHMILRSSLSRRPGLHEKC